MSLNFLDKTRDPFIKIVIYGKQGAGKTTIASTFPKPLILLDVKENGWIGIKDVKGIDPVSIKTWKEFEEAYWYLQENPDGYKTVVIDTASALQDLVLKYIADKKHVKLREGVKYGDFGTLSKRDWAEVSSLLKPFITQFRDLDMNVVFLAHEKVFNVEEDDSAEGIDPSVGPKLMQSVASTMNAAVDIIGQAFIREKKKEGAKSQMQYCLRVGPHPYYLTKVRKPKDVEVEPILVDPEYDDLINLTKGEN